MCVTGIIFLRIDFNSKKWCIVLVLRLYFLDRKKRITVLYSTTIIDFKLIVTVSQASPRDKHGKLLSNNQFGNK